MKKAQCIQASAEDAAQNAPKHLDQTQEKRLEQEWRARRRMREAHRLGFDALALLLVVWALFGWVVGLTTAPNGDMFPRIDAGDLLLYYRLDKDVKSRDVIVFEKNGTRYVGRVVAVAGDEVEITDEERLSVNGSVMLERGIYAATPRFEGYTAYPLRLGRDECFVLVDGREGCEDSRYFGPVHKDEIRGTVITVLRRSNL